MGLRILKEVLTAGHELGFVELKVGLHHTAWTMTEEHVVRPLQHTQTIYISNGFLLIDV